MVAEPEKGVKTLVVAGDGALGGGRGRPSTLSPDLHTVHGECL